MSCRGVQRTGRPPSVPPVTCFSFGDTPRGSYRRYMRTGIWRDHRMIPPNASDLAGGLLPTGYLEDARDSVREGSAQQSRNEPMPPTPEEEENARLRAEDLARHHDEATHRWARGEQPRTPEERERFDVYTGYLTGGFEGTDIPVADLM